MRAAVVEGISKPLVVREVPDPQCKPNGVIMRVEANGICRTDWHLWTGDWSWRGLEIQPPFVLGHEFCGVVEEVGPEVTRWKKGDRALFPMNPGDGACEWCRSGHQHVCDAGASLVPGVAYWGGFGRFVALPYADVNLVALPESVKFVDAAKHGLPLYGRVPRHRRSGAGLRRRVGGGARLRRHRALGGADRDGDGRQCDRDRRFRRGARGGARRRRGAHRQRDEGGPDRRRDDAHGRRRARVDRRARSRGHLPQLRHVPPHARPPSAARTHDERREG